MQLEADENLANSILFSKCLSNFEYDKVSKIAKGSLLCPRIDLKYDKNDY